jgi:hypothetical protein
MQTFLPYSDFEQSLRCLDTRRLGKQRIEAKQILATLLDRANTGGWRNHPAVKMWRGYEASLAHYGLTACRVWIGRGYKDTTSRWFGIMLLDYVEIVHPPWLGREDFHASHRSNLLRKSPEFYGKLGWTEPHDLPYVWPEGKP